MLEIFLPHGLSLDMAMKGRAGVNGTQMSSVLGGLTLCFALKAIVSDYFSLPPPAISAQMEHKSHIPLPPEITDRIIFHLRNDKQVLKTCSLVCKSWLPASRYHFFRAVSLHLPVSERCIEFLKTSVDILAPLVHHLHIQGADLGSCLEPRAVERLTPLLAVLTRVEALRLCNLDIRDLDTTIVPVTSTFAITQLELYDVVFHDVNEMANFISHFPHLTCLNVCPQFRTYAVLDPTAPRLPAGVHSVGYSVGVAGEGREICDWIASSKERIHHIDLGIYSEYVDYGYHAILSELFKTLEPHLHRADISFIDGQPKEGGPRHKDLKLIYHFRSRSAVSYLSQAQGHRSLSVLLSLFSIPVSNVIVNVLEPEVLYAEDWSKVDDFLDDPTFSELCDLSFQLPGPFCEEPLHKTFLESTLNNCYAKGILRTT